MILIQSENLKNVVVALLEKGGSNAEEANTVASHLVRSNLCGHDSHGGRNDAALYEQAWGRIAQPEPET